VREQLAHAARYIDAHDKLREKHSVAVFAFNEIGRIAVALGFRRMEIQHMNFAYERDLGHIHQAFCAVNGIDRPFQTTAAYLPTDEFITQFGAASPEQPPDNP
jgi:hypothetical protein